MGEAMRKIRHVIESQQWDRAGLEELFKFSRVMKEDVTQRYPKSRRHCDCLRGYLMASLFYEESTRTRFSHEAAMLRLGGRIISTENARVFSSVSKGETLEDTIRTVAAYVDVIVLRHHEKQVAHRAAAVSTVPIINAGDGPGQHPTQALLDVFTIEDELGDIDGKTITFVGDLANSRTEHSRAYLLGKFQPQKLVFVSDPSVGMPIGIKQYLDRHGVAWEETADLDEAASRSDVICATRIQKNRLGLDDPDIADEERRRRQEWYDHLCQLYRITPATLKLMPTKSIVMHPLPRVNEIAVEVDSDPRAAYFRQMENGLYVRMALLHNILNQDCF
jgi:aspartate carbamoyltransferase catalytic subunit